MSYDFERIKYRKYDVFLKDIVCYFIVVIFFKNKKILKFVKRIKFFLCFVRYILFKM